MGTFQQGRTEGKKKREKEEKEEKRREKRRKGRKKTTGYKIEYGMVQVGKKRKWKAKKDDFAVTVLGSFFKSGMGRL